MYSSFSTCFLALSVLITNVHGQLSHCPQPELGYTPPVVLPGYSLTKLVGNLSHPRQIITDNNHNLLVSSFGQGILGFTPTFDSNNCPSVTAQKLLIPDDGMNFTHALVLSNDGKTLFASTPDVVLAWEYDAQGMRATSKEKVVVHGMLLPSSLSQTRTMAIPKEYPNILLVFRGELGDVTKSLDYGAADAANGRAQIKAFDLTKIPKDGYDYTRDGHIFVQGVRDTLEFVQDRFGNFWNVDNGADEITREGNFVGGSNPADELNFLGRYDPYNADAAKTVPDFGYPYCQAVWNASNITDNTARLRVGNTFSTSPEKVTDVWCNDYTRPPALSIFPHSAPLGLRFYNPVYPSLGPELVGLAFVSYHGPAGHKIVIVPFSNGRLAAPATSQEGTIDFVWTDKSIDRTECLSELNPTSKVKCISPVGMVFGEYGKMFFTSDVTGEIFVVTRVRSPYVDPYGLA